MKAGIRARGLIAALFDARLLGAALLVVVSTCSNLRAQTFSVITGREPVTSLDGLWRFQIGDNPAWADPNFDDSNWPLIRSDESWTRQGYPAFNGYAWYRFKVEVPGDGRPVAVLLKDIVSGYTVYADGKLIGSAGSATTTRDPVFYGTGMFTLPAGAREPHSTQIALRVWSYRPIASWVGAGPRGGGHEVGDTVLLSRQLRSYKDYRAVNYVTEYTYGLFAGLVGLAILALFLLRPQDKEYFWFAVLLLGQCAAAALHMMVNLGSLPMPLWDVLRLVAEGASLIAALEFFRIVLGVRRSALWWVICILVALIPLTAALIYFQWTGMGVSFAIYGACILPAYVWIIARLFIGAIRKDASARLLLVPVVLTYAMDCAGLAARIAWQLTGSSHLFSSDVTLFEQPYPISLSDVFGLIFLLALLIFLVRRFSLARKEEERMAGEFEAAKTVQSLLVPVASPATPGFAVENVYLPAQEVGGDFFQVLPGDDGSLLIVVGDVSGKGLKAAMTVSAIVGALRGCTVRSPAKVLAHLNGALRGQMSGFFTCSAALIDADGKLTIANAGHLSPYLNGEELDVPPGLPLGIADEDTYEEMSWQLDANNSLTFVSDGVVEARNGAGELYGFARTSSISALPAREIAEAARRFGQDDDITVLTVRRVAVLEAVTV